MLHFNPPDPTESLIKVIMMGLDNEWRIVDTAFLATPLHTEAWISRAPRHEVTE